MGVEDRADEERDMVSVIKERVEVGEYSIDPQAVAAAMLGRSADRSLLGELWSEMLIAMQPSGGAAGEREA